MRISAFKSHSVTFKVLSCSLLFSFIFSVLPFKEAFAVRTTYESFVSTDAQKIQFIGDLYGGQFGSALERGDFNNDGIDDLVVGSPFSSTGMNDWNGKISIIFGKSIFKSKTFDLKNSFPDISIFGEGSGDQFGTSIAVGDFNGDGLDDLAVSAYNAYLYDVVRPGKVYVFYNQSLVSSSVIDLSISSPDVLFTGNSNGDNLGLSLKASDLNRDAVDDLLIGAPNASAFNLPHCGAVYAFYGKLSSGFKYPLYDMKNKRPNATFYGKTSDEKFGSEIETSDFNGDHRKEIVIGAYAADSGDLVESGKVYIFKQSEIDGKYSFPSVSTDPYLTFEGDQSGGWFGFSIKSGYLNNDKIDDLAITSFPYSTHENNGKVSFFYGSRTLFYSTGVVAKDYEYKNVSVEQPAGENFLGTSVLMDDFNNDGFADLAVGAPGIGESVSSEAGAVYMVYGDFYGFKPSYSISNKDITSTIHGENADDWFGYDMISLDFNGDGIKDLAVGSRYSEGHDSVNNGKVFVLLGKDSPYGQAKDIPEPSDMPVTRGDFVNKVMEKFDVKNNKSAELAGCNSYLDFCLFNFMAMSTYDKIRLIPDLILFPDVPKGSKYYEGVNIGTMLGVLNGYYTQNGSPFRPELPITRIQALKVILGLNNLVIPKYRFELISMLGSYNALVNQPSGFTDINAKISSMWWYPRYANFALENGIVDPSEYFRPDDNITVSELDDMINRTLKLINLSNAETVISGNSKN